PARSSGGETHRLVDRIDVLPHLAVRAVAPNTMGDGISDCDRAGPGKRAEPAAPWEIARRTEQLVCRDERQRLHPRLAGEQRSAERSRGHPFARLPSVLPTTDIGVQADDTKTCRERKVTIAPPHHGAPGRAAHGKEERRQGSDRRKRATE